MDYAKLSRLSEILKNSDVIQDKDWRKEVIFAASEQGILQSACDKFINVDNTRRFATSFANIVKAACQTNHSLLPELDNFFTELLSSDSELSGHDENRLFIELKIQKALQQAASTNQRPQSFQKHQGITENMQNGRAAQAAQQEEPRPSGKLIDKNLIVDFNLDELLPHFHKTLKEGFRGKKEEQGVFSFYLSLEYGREVLDGYVIERLTKELRGKTEREVTVYWADVNELHLADLLGAIYKQREVEKLSDLLETVDTTVTDIILVIRNDKIPSMTFFAEAGNCCHEIEQQLKQYVGSPARCFITLWANANAEPLVEKDVSRKCLLQVPESLNMDDLRLWLNKRFKNDKDMFNQLMNTVTCQNGEICAVYRSLRGSVQAVRR